MAKSRKKTKVKNMTMAEEIVDGQLVNPVNDLAGNTTNTARNAIPLPPPMVKRDKSKEGWLISKLRHPVTIAYDSQSIMVPPLGKKKIFKVTRN